MIDQPGVRKDRVRREVASFVRRSARMRPQQRLAWNTYRQRFVLDVPRGELSTSVAPGTPPLDLIEVFGRDAPLIVEIGPGTGESLIPLARSRPGANVLAFEVYQPALATLVRELARHELDNVRLAPVDAVDGLTQLLSGRVIDRVWTFFPDPWPKARHHKRRLVDRDFADLVAARTKRGAVWRLATDWEDYAGTMREVLDDHPAFMNTSPQGWAPRWAARPVTRFEQRGIDAGRHIFDLAYQRISDLDRGR